MARRMISPQVIIKSQVGDNEERVDLNEILEKYGIQIGANKSVTLQLYSQEVADDNNLLIKDDTSERCKVLVNTAITITKMPDGNVFIGGLLVDDYTGMNLIPYIMVPDGEYKNGIMLINEYNFDVHVVKV